MGFLKPKRTAFDIFVTGQGLICPTEELRKEKMNRVWNIKRGHTFYFMIILSYVYNLKGARGESLFFFCYCAEQISAQLTSSRIYLIGNEKEY